MIISEPSRLLEMIVIVQCPRIWHFSSALLSISRGLLSLCDFLIFFWRSGCFLLLSPPLVTHSMVSPLFGWKNVLWAQSWFSFLVGVSCPRRLLLFFLLFLTIAGTMSLSLLCLALKHAQDPNIEIGFCFDCLWSVLVSVLHPNPYSMTFWIRNRITDPDQVSSTI